MIKWEYKMLRGSFSAYNTDELNELGAVGWEVCGVVGGSGYGTTILFKRQVSDATTP